MSFLQFKNSEKTNDIFISVSKYLLENKIFTLALINSIGGKKASAIIPFAFIHIYEGWLKSRYPGKIKM